MARFPIPGHPGGPPGAERPDRPFTGYKLARAVLSADCATTAFAGLTLGAERVYGVTADASCVWTPRHAPPRRWCGCGFYCLHELADAQALGCATENRAALLIEVAASGRYIRYERGLRFSRQRVRVILDALVRLRSPGTALTDAGTGLIGWRHLAPICARCTAGGRSSACGSSRPAGRPVRVAALLSASPLSLGPPADGPLSGAGASNSPTRRGAPPGRVPAAGTPGSADRERRGNRRSPCCAAEIALLHARLDDLQSRLDR